MQNAMRIHSQYGITVPEAKVVDDESISSGNVFVQAMQPCLQGYQLFGGIDRLVKEDEAAEIGWDFRLCCYNLPVFCSSTEVSSCLVV